MTTRKKVADKLNEALGAAAEILNSDSDIITIAPESVVVIPETSSSVNKQDDMSSFDAELLEDYTHTRNTLRMLIRKGEAALSSAMQLADSSDAPRAYEVVSQLMATISDASMELLELQKRIRDLKRAEAKATASSSQGQPAAGTTTITNNTLVLQGNTNDLQQRLKEMGIALPVPK